MIELTHLKKANMTYSQHFRFAVGISLNLLWSSLWFMVHGFMPIIQIPSQWNLESASERLNKANLEVSKR